MNMVRSTLKGRNLSNEYWAEAVACAIYVINSSPTKSVMNRVLEQAREQSKAYKLYNPITKKTIISRDVVFKEQELWNGTVDKIVDAQVPLMEEDDVAEKEQQESQVKTPNIDTPTRTPRFSKQHGSSSRSTDQDSPSNQSGDFDIDEFKEDMVKEFEMTDLGLMKYFLSIEVEKSEKGIFICQNNYSKDLLKRFKTENCKPIPTSVATHTKLRKDDEGSNVNPTLFKRLVGSLMYLAATRPDIMQGISMISRFMETPKDTHYSAGKRIMRYIAGIKDCGIMYASTEKKELIGYTDSDFAGSLDDRKSTYDFLFHLGLAVISWASKKQPIVTLSSAEAEYVTTTSTTCQAVWLRRVLDGLKKKQQGSSTIYCDNSSAIALSTNSVFHKKSKHIDTRYHFIRELVSNGEVHLKPCKSSDQLADIFIKSLTQDVFEFHRRKLGVVSLPET
eukprot:PITA_05127